MNGMPSVTPVASTTAIVSGGSSGVTPSTMAGRRNAARSVKYSCGICSPAKRSKGNAAGGLKLRSGYALPAFQASGILILIDMPLVASLPRGLSFIGNSYD